MPYNTKEKQKEYNKNYYEIKKCPQSKARTNYIINFYSTIKKEYDFMMWVRNIRRVNKHLFCAKVKDNKGESQDIILHDETAYIDCIKSFLKVGERYISLLPSSKANGLPMFFTIKEIGEEIIVSYVKISFIKHGDGSAQFIPQWENAVRDIVLDNKNLYNIRLYSESEKYKYPFYFVIKGDVMAFYNEKKWC